MLTKHPNVRIFVLLISFFAKPAAANSGPDEFEFSSSFGIGTQYAGLLGAQFGVDNQKHKVYGALGLIGVGAGYNFAASENIAVGVNLFYLGLVAGYGLNINYYFESTFSIGWMVGIDLSRTSDIGGGSQVLGLVSLGYEF